MMWPEGKLSITEVSSMLVTYKNRK